MNIYREFYIFEIVWFWLNILRKKYAFIIASKIKLMRKKKQKSYVSLHAGGTPLRVIKASQDKNIYSLKY